jgi:hypothetical protein
VRWTNGRATPHGARWTRERPVVAVRLRALGDVVLATAAFRSLAEGHRGSPLHVVTESRFAPLLEGQPGIARVWPLERTNRRHAGHFERCGASGPRSPWTSSATRAARSWRVPRARGASWGFDMRGRRALYHATVPRVVHASSEQREYAAASLLRLARAAGGADVPARPHLTLTERARREGAAALAAAGVDQPSRTVALVPGGLVGHEDLAAVARGRARAPIDGSRPRRAGDRRAGGGAGAGAARGTRSRRASPARGRRGGAGRGDRAAARARGHRQRSASSRHRVRHAHVHVVRSRAPRGVDTRRSAARLVAHVLAVPRVRAHRVPALELPARARSRTRRLAGARHLERFSPAAPAAGAPSQG